MRVQASCSWQNSNGGAWGYACNYFELTRRVDEIGKGNEAAFRTVFNLGSRARCASSLNWSQEGSSSGSRARNKGWRHIDSGD